MISLLYQIPSCLQRLYRGVVWRAELPFPPSASFPQQGQGRSAAEKAPCPFRGKGLGKGAQGAQGAPVYLTFDDGPIPEVTPRILEILREKQVKATFFCVGDNVRKYPHLLEAILADGHSVGNHTFHHLPGLQTRTADYLRDVAEAEQLIASYLPSASFPAGEDTAAEKSPCPFRGKGQGKGAPLFRPPYGRMRPSQKRELLRRGYTIVLWDVLTHDYNPRYSSARLVEIVRRYTRPGSVVVFHDSLKSGERMLAALPEAIDFWLSEGYTLRPL